MLKIIRYYFESHRSALINTCSHIKKAPLTTVLSISLIAVSLSLPGTLLVLLNSSQGLLPQSDRPALISVYLSPQLSTDLIAQTELKIAALDGIKQTAVISAEQAWTQFEQQAELQNSLLLLDSNPFPATVEVSILEDYATGMQLDTLLLNLKHLPYVERVETNIVWLQRLDALVHFMQTLAVLLAVLFTMVALLVVSNITRSDCDSRAEEIAVQELLGATAIFVRRPFLYSGLTYGLLGGLGAAIITIVASTLLHSELQDLSELYSIGRLEELNYFIIALYSVVAALSICLLATRIALLNYRRSIEHD